MPTQTKNTLTLGTARYVPPATSQPRRLIGPKQLPDKGICYNLNHLERDVQDEWQFVHQKIREKFKFTPTLIADGEALREAALAGCGVIRVLAWEIADQLQSGTLVRLLPDWECLGGLPIVAIYRKTRATQLRMNALLQHLTNEFQPYDSITGRINSPRIT
jgi:DNA-binding transcriptional LysR family regulator